MSMTETPEPNGQGSQLANQLAAQIVTPLQNIVVKLGQILQALGGPTGFYANKSIAFAQSPYTTLPTDEFIEVDATAGNVAITLSAIGNPQISVKKIDASGNSVTVTGTIDGAGSVTTTTQYKAWNFKRDAANNWWLF